MGLGIWSGLPQRKMWRTATRSTLAPNIHVEQTNSLANAQSDLQKKLWSRQLKGWSYYQMCVGSVVHGEKKVEQWTDGKRT
jgi:hypothetical protein